MQFPNAIGMMVDILNGVDVESISNVTDSASLISGEEPAVVLDEKKVQMKSIAVEMMGYFTIGAICTGVHSGMFDSVGQVSLDTIIYPIFCDYLMHCLTRSIRYRLKENWSSTEEAIICYNNATTCIIL